MKKIRKNKNRDSDDSDRWVVSYADFVTLLFAFFVVMYAISTVNDAKYKSLSEGIHSAFNNKEQGKTTNAHKVADNAKAQDTGSKDSSAESDALNHLTSALSEFNNQGAQLSHGKGFVQLQLSDSALFNSGTADLKPAALVNLMLLAGKLNKSSFPIVVEGFTDNVPINTPQFPSNWELSAARAATVARVLNTYGVASHRLTVTGFGDQYPIADNVTKWGRSKNRRVNIVIAKNKNIFRLISPEVTQLHTIRAHIDEDMSYKNKEIQ